MKYVYKIVGNFTDDNFVKITNKISKKFVYIYFNNALFVALKSWSDFDGSNDLINKTFRPVKNFYIEEITEKNVSDQIPVVKEWCLNNLVRLDTERYESENQKKLHEVWKAMDNMEAQLCEELNNKARKEVKPSDKG